MKKLKKEKRIENCWNWKKWKKSIKDLLNTTNKPILQCSVALCGIYPPRSFITPKPCQEACTLRFLDQLLIVNLSLGVPLVSFQVEPNQSSILVAFFSLSPSEMCLKLYFNGGWKATHCRTTKERRHMSSPDLIFPLKIIFLGFWWKFSS